MVADFEVEVHFILFTYLNLILKLIYRSHTNTIILNVASTSSDVVKDEI